jgi:DSF synthase
MAEQKSPPASVAPPGEPEGVVRPPTAAPIEIARAAVSALRQGNDLRLALMRGGFTELEFSFWEADRALLANHRAERPAHFSPALLTEVRRLHRVIAETFARRAGQDAPLHYLVWRSRHEGIYNLGGDLDLISGFIKARDKSGLTDYARACVETCFDNATKGGSPIISMALVEGAALGGGFESALSNDLIVAEKRARFGFPEILFGLFPGMGAYTFLARRAGTKLAERAIFSGRIFTAEELAELGVVDVLVEDGHGEEAVRQQIRSVGRHFAAHRSIYRVRRDFNRVTLDEMMSVAESWVDTALQLDDHDIKRMRRLLTMQERRRTGEAGGTTALRRS